jgi:hypothetical protein
LVLCDPRPRPRLHPNFLTVHGRYDDADTLAWKYQSIARHGLGGGGMWAANMLDYTQPLSAEVWDALLQAVAVA